MSGGALSGKRILVVEDETMIAMLIEDFLCDMGCTVVGPVARVEHALEALTVEDIDGAVLDVNLDGQSSYQIADELAARLLPFIFVTGYGGQGIAPAYRDRPVVQKPFTHEMLEQALAKFMSHA